MDNKEPGDSKPAATLTDHRARWMNILNNKSGKRPPPQPSPQVEMINCESVQGAPKNHRTGHGKLREERRVKKGEEAKKRPPHTTVHLARGRNAAEMLKITAVVHSVLFNPDVVFLLADLLDARDLCQVSLTCRALGGRQAAPDGLSSVEKVAKRLFECASVWERSCLPKYDDEGWIELYHHLLMLRSKLTFDQLVGCNVQYGAGQTSIQTVPGAGMTTSSALCSNHVMRSGRHLAVFTTLNRTWHLGIVRPVRINESDFEDGELDSFYPGYSMWEYLLAQRTERWNGSDVHCCCVFSTGVLQWYDWMTHDPHHNGRMIDGFQEEVLFGLLLDLDKGTLTMYQNGRTGTLKDGLSGEYCWFASCAGALPYHPAAARNDAFATIVRDRSPERLD